MKTRNIHSIRVELWKAIHNPFFYISILIGTGLVLMDSFNVYTIIADLIKSIDAGKQATIATYENISLYGVWLPIGGLSSGARTFLYVWPILAALPFGWSYWSERKNGSYGSIVMKTGKRTYFLSKCIACFVSGGMVIALPLLINLCVDALFCPIPIPSVKYGYYPIINGWFLSKLFYTHPWIYCLSWCGVCFLWGGATSVLCMAAGSKPRLMVTVILLPFLVYMVTEILLRTVVRSMYRFYLTLSPLQMVMAAPGDPNPCWVVLGEWGLLLILGILISYRQVVKHEF